MYEQLLSTIRFFTHFTHPLPFTCPLTPKQCHIIFILQACIKPSDRAKKKLIVMSICFVVVDTLQAHLR